MRARLPVSDPFIVPPDSMIVSPQRAMVGGGAGASITLPPPQQLCTELRARACVCEVSSRVTSQVRDFAWNVASVCLVNASVKNTLSFILKVRSHIKKAADFNLDRWKSN